MLLTDRYKTIYTTVTSHILVLINIQLIPVFLVRSSDFIKNLFMNSTTNNFSYDLNIKDETNI